MIIKSVEYGVVKQDFLTDVRKLQLRNTIFIYDVSK
jgi:hypothetical protein